MLEKNLNLADVTLVAYKSFLDPFNKELEQAVNDCISHLVVLEYLPLKEKKATIFRIINLLKENNKRPDEIHAQLEILFTLEVINNYTNINVEDNFYEFFSDDFIDALETTGIIDAIEAICGRDMDRLRYMLDSTINWRNIFSLVDGFGNIDMSHVDALVQEVRTVKESLKEENLDLLKRITDYNQPNVQNFSDMLSASLVNSLDKISDDQIAKWHEQQDLIIDLDKVLGAKSYDNITKEITEYFTQHAELGTVSDQEIQNVYEYLKEKNQNTINKLDYSIAEENRSSIEKGLSTQMIKLLSKKKALEKKYQKEEELLKLADSIMSMDSTNIDEVIEVLHKYQKTINTDQEDGK